MTDTNCAMKIAMMNATTMTVEAHERRHLELVDDAYMLADGITQLERAGEMAFDLEEWDVFDTRTGERVNLDDKASGYDERDGALTAMMVSCLECDGFIGDNYDARKVSHVQRSQWIRQAQNKFDDIMKRIRDNKNQLAHARNMAQVS